MAGPWDSYKPIPIAPAAPAQAQPVNMPNAAMPMQKPQPWLKFQNAGAPVDGGYQMPAGTQFDTVSGQLRAIVAKLPTDQMRKQALEQTLQRRGIPNPQVQGSGRDWVYYDGETGAYKALTNTPGWDMYDAIEGGMELPRLVGSAAGAAGGTALAGPAGGLVGAGAGGALADTATRAAMSLWSPEFKSVAEENLGEMGKDIGVNAAIDAGSFGVAKYAGPAVKSLLGRPAGEAVSAVMNKGVVGPALKGTGTAVESGGKIVANTARALQTPTGRSVATMAIPGVGDAEVVGELARLPAAGARNLPHGMQSVGSIPFVQEHFPKAAEWLRGTGQSIRRGAQESAKAPLTERVAQGLSMGAEEGVRKPTAGGVLRELGQRGAARAGASEGTQQTAARAGEMIGSGLETVADAGKALATTARGVAGVGLGGAQVAGRGAQAVGATVRGAGTLLSPVESRAALMGLGKYGKDKYREDLERLQRARMRANIEHQVLADN